MYFNLLSRAADETKQAYRTRFGDLVTTLNEESTEYTKRYEADGETWLRPDGSRRAYLSFRDL